MCKHLVADRTSWIVQVTSPPPRPLRDTRGRCILTLEDRSTKCLTLTSPELLTLFHLFLSFSIKPTTCCRDLWRCGHSCLGGERNPDLLERLCGGCSLQIRDDSGRCSKMGLEHAVGMVGSRCRGGQEKELPRWLWPA